MTSCCLARLVGKTHLSYDGLQLAALVGREAWRSAGWGWRGSCNSATAAAVPLLAVARRRLLLRRLLLLWGIVAALRLLRGVGALLAAGRLAVASLLAAIRRLLAAVAAAVALLLALRGRCLSLLAALLAAVPISAGSTLCGEQQVVDRNVLVAGCGIRSSAPSGIDGQHWCSDALNTVGTPRATQSDP